MRSTPHHILHPLAVALVAAAAAAPPAAADHQDLRWPDAKDAERSYLEPVTIERSQDLRMPDRRDTVPGVTGTAPATEFVRVSADGGFDWADAGIGAAAAIGIVLIGAGGALGAARMRRRPAAA
jgi:hypothetical protein